MRSLKRKREVSMRFVSFVCVMVVVAGSAAAEDVPATVGTPTAPAPAAPGASVTAAPGATQTVQQPQADPLMSMLPIIGLVLFFYFAIIRPQNKQRKELEQLMNSIKPKDRVVTQSGIIGTVAEVEKDELVMIIDPKKDIRIRVLRNSVISRESSEKEKEKEKVA